MGKMPKAVIVIAFEIKNIAEPVEKGVVRVCRMAADHKDHGVEADENIDEIREAEIFESRHQDDERNDGRHHFQKPSEIVARSDPRPNED